MDKITAKKVGQRINSILADKNMLQKELAEILGVPANTISYFASGERMPNTKQIIEISKHLNVSADYILGISDVKSLNETIQGVNRLTGLAEETIAKLKVEKVCGDNEIANFIDWIVSHPEFIDLIKAIDKANEFAENPKTALVDVGDRTDEMDMFSIYKTHVNDMFWKIIEGYHIGSIRIEGESDAK